MKNHTLTSVCETVTVISLNKSQYSFENQITIQNKNEREYKETRSIERTDPDEIFEINCGSTGITESIENSDPDELYFSSTVYTATIETSDPDEILI